MVQNVNTYDIDPPEVNMNPCSSVFCFLTSQNGSVLLILTVKLYFKMETSSSDSANQETEHVNDYTRSSLPEKRDSSPGRPGKKKLEALLNGHLKIKMTDGRVLIGIFLCTDRDANVILGSCSEYLREEDCCTEEPRILGLVMVPGRHIVSIHKDQC